ncbi:MAG: leucine-rich repeat protein [Clostridia bacterium]|nr:leucine-rich repeat protein [Clostridia bacterium]
MRKTKTTLLLLAVALLVLALCACQPTIKVTFDLGYDGKTEVKTYQKGEKADYAPTRADYDFAGWYKDPDLTQAWGDSVLDEDITLYAKWTPRQTTQVTVTLNYNYIGAPASKQVSVTKGTAYTPEIPERENYDFAGWFTDSSFTPPPFSNGTVVNEDITLYARWQVKPEVQVDVTLNLNYAGAPAPAVVSIARGETLNTPDPERNGFEFAGWYLEDTLNTAFDVSAQINEDLTLYAKWEALPELRFELSSDGSSYAVYAGAFKGGELDIPDVYDGKPVTEVKAEGFKNAGVTKVFVPDSVTKIGKGAFAGNDIVELTVPVIGDGADNAFLAYIFGADSSRDVSAVPQCLKKVVISGGATVADALYGLDFVSDVTLPALGSVNEILSVADVFGGDEFIGGIEKLAILGGDFINEGALAGLSALKELTVPFVGATKNDTGNEGFFGYIFGSVAYNGSFLIYQSNSAEDYVTPDVCLSFYIPSGLKRVTVLGGDIADGAFMNMRTLDTIAFADDADTIYIGEAAFMGTAALESFTLPQGVNTIGDYAFCFSGARTVDMSRAVELKSLPEFVFGECARLARVILPDGLETVEAYAFYMASVLTNVNIPDGVTSIGAYAFYYCARLPEINIPASVAEIGGQAFGRCLELALINVDSRNQTYATYDGILYDKELTQAYVIPAGIRGPVRIPATMTIIPANFFNECKYLKSVVFHDNITGIGDSAFAYCTGLETMTIGKGVTTIMGNAFAFAGNENTVINFAEDSKYAWVQKDTFYRFSAAEINLPASAQTFDGEAFRMCTAEINFHEDSTITQIVNDMFKDWLGTSIELPQSVTTIGARAFMDALNLETIVFDATKVTSVGFDAFRNTKWYNSQPDGIVVLNGLAYEIKGARNTLTSVTLPQDTLLLAGSLFNGCSNLTTLVLNEGLLSISGSAFANCVSLTEIVIPSTVTGIGAQAFNNVSATIVFAPDGSLTHLGDQAFYGYKGRTINVPDYVETLGASVFYNFEGEIVFGADSAITEIGASAFANYYGRALELPAGVTKINGSAFSGAIYLTELTLPQGLKTVESRAFTGMNSIKTLTVPAGIEVLRENVFAGFNGNYVTFEGTTPPQVLNAAGETATNIGIRGGTSTAGHVIVMVPSSALEAYRTAFGETELVYSTIDESDKDFVIVDTQDGGKRLIAYAGDAVDKIEIPSGVTEIGPAALSQGNGTKFKADGLNYVVVPASVTEVNGNSLSGVRVVEFLGEKMPAKGNEGIGQWASNNKVSVVIVPDGKKDVFRSDTANFGPATLHKNLFEKSEFDSNGFAISNGELKAALGTSADITVPDSVTRIGERAFYGLSTLETVTMGNKVTSIGTDAFRECLNLKSVTLSSEITEIGNYAFGNCRSLEEITLPAKLKTLGTNVFNECVSLTKVIFNDQLESIGNNAFAKSALSGNLVLPSTLTSLGDGAFNSTLIESVTLPDNLKIMTYNYANGAFGMCYRLKTVSLGGLISIPQYMFQYCSSLESIDLTGISDIGPDAFNNCVSLNELTLPEGLKTIGARAFAQCHSLVSVTTPESLESIGASAFGAQGSAGNYPTTYSQCRNLRYVHIKGAPVIGDMAFFYCPIETLVIDGWVKSTAYQMSGTNAFAATAITSLTLGDGVEFISMAAFERSPVQSIVLPSSVTELASYAFRRTTALTSLTFADPATSRLETIGSYAFDNSALTSIALPDNYTRLTGYVFRESNIEQITLGANTARLDNNAFYGSKITTMFLPKTLTHVGGGIFNNCVNLETVYVEATEEEITSWIVASVDYGSEGPQWHQLWSDGMPDGAEIVYGYVPGREEN